MPVETICRELDYKLLIGAMLAKENNIIIGHFNVIDDIISHTSNGLYVGKSIFKQLFHHSDNSINHHYYNILKQHNYDLIYLDEEGGVYAGDPDNWCDILNQRIQADILDENDTIATWGKFQQQHYEKQISHTDSKPLISTTGHPRFDLLKPKYRKLYENEVKNLKDKFGNYVLINTNLTLANNIMGISDTYSERLGYLKDNNRRIRYIEQWAHTTTVFANFIELIHKLAIEFPDMNFIIRAHPSENQNYYKTAFNAIDNVIINSEGSVIPWLIGSKLMIHDGCTTAIEAYLSQTPVINFKSVTNEKHDLSLPNKIGTKCHNISEVISTIENILHNKNSYLKLNDFEDIDYLLLQNLKQDTVDDLINLITSKVKIKKTEKGKTLSTQQLYIKELISSLSKKLKDTVKFIFFPKKYKMNQLSLRKFPGFKKENIQSKIDVIENIIGYKLDVKIISDRVLIIKKKV